MMVFEHLLFSLNLQAYTYLSSIPGADPENEEGGKRGHTCREGIGAARVAHSCLCTCT